MTFRKLAALVQSRRFYQADSKGKGKVRSSGNGKGKANSKGKPSGKKGAGKGQRR